MVLLAALASCRAPSVRTTAVYPAPSPPDTHELQDATYDWHALLIVPFDSKLKDIPLTLHEVLLFREVGHGAAAADEAECYAADTAAPRFFGRAPEEYLLCFKQDRLARIQASVRLPTAQASDAFDTACANWLKNVEPTDAAPRIAVASNPSAPGAVTCEGREGSIHFNARLGEEPARVEASPTETTETQSTQAETILSITLDSSSEP